MRCPNCEGNNWENVDRFRMKQTTLEDDPANKGKKIDAPVGMSICNTCGFVSYPSKWKSEEEIKKHYRSAYRTPPTSFNIFAGERKNHFHHKFLEETFAEWKEKGIDSPKICEIGAAFGFTLQWLRRIFPKAELYGTELTTSFRRNAFHEFGINLTEDIDETQKYDLIISYKVLEHQLDPDKCLEKYRKCLKPGGLFYLSVPTWFNSMCNFGAGGFDLEYYYDPNHINVWTRDIFEGMVSRAGFKTLKKDHVMYNDTYLLTEGPIAATKPFMENPTALKEKMKNIKEAFIASSENRFDDAIALWPDYPNAHVSKAEMTRKSLQEKGWEWFRDNILLKAIKECPTSPEAYVMATDYAMRAQKFDEAIRYCEKSLEMKPENPVSLNQMANIMREYAIRAKDNPKEQVHYYVQAREVARHIRNVSSQHFKEATDMIYLFNSFIPFKGENDGSQPAVTTTQTKTNVLPFNKEKRNASPEATV